MSQVLEIQQKLRQLLTQLTEQAQRFEQLPLAQKQRIFPLQDPQFSSASCQLTDYTNELNSDLNRLQEQINKGGNLIAIEYLCEQLSFKFKQLHYALKRVSKLRKPTTVKRFIAQNTQFKSRTTSLYQKLTQQQDYERQLEDKIRERELRLKNQPSSTAQLQNEILTLKQRLGRCKQATYQIETAILQYEKRR